jgi:putative glutamine amidotransferase
VSRPVVGICAAIERASWGAWDTVCNLSPRSYSLTVQAAGGLGLLLPPDDVAAEQPAEVLDLLDGLMLAGGSDVDPASYGARPHPETRGSWPERDRFELALAHAALERDMPVLGICRGMQLLNVACGGTLNQHLVGDDGVPSHRRVIGTFDGTEHEIDFEPGSLVERALGEPVHEARCHHHQAIDRLGEGLVVSGRARDGVAEAIELADGGGWALGVQWHPETGDKRELFEAFVAAARAVKQH